MKIKRKPIYWSPSATVDAVIFTVHEGELKVILIRRPNQPFYGMPALPGGFLHKGEISRRAIARILKDKVGITGVYTEQLYTFDEPGRDPRGQVISIVYFALVDFGSVSLPEIKLEKPFFQPVNHLPRLAFDHSEIVNYAWKRLQAKLEYTNVVYSLLPELFSMSDLQKAYEIILGRKLDKRNFIKKFMSLGIIRETKEIRRGLRRRPAKLYRFVSRKPTELKKFF